MSYLRGPLTRNQIKTLMDPIKRQSSDCGCRQQPAGSNGRNCSRGRGTCKSATGAGIASPCCRRKFPSISFRFEVREATTRSLVYHPQLLGAAEVRFSDKRVDTTRQLTLLAPITDGVVAVDWDQASSRGSSRYRIWNRVPKRMHSLLSCRRRQERPRATVRWQKDLAGWLYRSQKLELAEEANGWVRLRILTSPNATSAFACSRPRASNAMRP